jgi:hypothetical protein
MERAAMPAAPTTIQRPAATPTPAVSTAAATFTPLDLDEFDRPQIESVDYLDALTPHSLPDSEHVVWTVR